MDEETKAMLLQVLSKAKNADDFAEITRIVNAAQMEARATPEY